MGANWAGIKAALATTAANTSGIAQASSTELQGVPDTPCVLITHVESVTQTDRGAGYRSREAVIKGLLLCGSPGDIGDAVAVVEAQCELLQDAYETGVLLGYAGTVQDSYLDSWIPGPQTYAKADWLGADLTFKVTVRENLARTP